MLLKKNKSGGFMDVIRCDEPEYLIWKWHPTASESGKNKRENAIRWGSSLRVREGSVAVFVYSQPDGTVQDYIEGPCDARLDTLNFPVLTSIRGLLYGGDTPFQAEVYFINLARIIQVRFGVPYFDVYDPRVLDFGVPVAVRGTITFRISDYKEFIKLNRLQTFSLEDFQKQIRDTVVRYVKDTVANAPAANNIPVVQIESKVSLINDAIEHDIGERLKEDFGVTVSGVDISAIEIDKTSDGYRKLMAVTQDIATATIEARANVDIKQMQDKQRIDAENYEETLRIQREEAQYAQRKQTQTAHVSAYQIESQTAVGLAGAEALGKMGASGAGGVDLGSGSTGFNPASMMAGMALGGAVGQNIAGVMNSMMGGINQPPVPGAVPPPVPVVAYHVAVNGQATGPFDMMTLTQMATTGQLNTDSLVWKNGMAQWEKAGTMDDLKDIFETSMPPIPPIATL